MDRHIEQMRRETARKRRLQDGWRSLWKGDKSHRLWISCEPSQNIWKTFYFDQIQPDEMYSVKWEGTKIFSANKFKCFPVIHYGEYTMLTWRSLNQLQLLSDHLTLTRQPEKSHLYDKYGVPCSKVWLHFRSITQFDWCLTYWTLPTMQESAAAKLPLLRGNCGDFNSNKRVKKKKEL